MDCITTEIENFVSEDMAAGDAPDATVIHDTPSCAFLPAQEEEVISPSPPPPTTNLRGSDSSSLIAWSSDDPLRCKSNSKAHRNQRNAVGLQKEPSLRVGQSRSNCCLPVTVHPQPQTLSLTLLRPLMSCAVCTALPIQTLAVHTCRAGHQVCGHCYTAGHNKCETCQSFFECRNEVLEGVLQRLRLVCPGLFPRDEQEARESPEQHTPRAVQHSSHRPLDCPHLTCYRVVAANGFLAHFEFEHPSVPVFQMTPGYYIHFSLPDRLLDRNLPRVVAVIEVNVISGKGYEVMEKRSLTPSFPVRRDAVVCALLCATVTADTTPAPTRYLAAWCSSLYEDPLPLTYVLHTSTPAAGRITYQGAMTSLHVSQDPVSILQEGQCLVLAPRSHADSTVPLDLKFIAMKH